MMRWRMGETNVERQSQQTPLDTETRRVRLDCLTQAEQKNGSLAQEKIKAEDRGRLLKSR